MRLRKVSPEMDVPSGLAESFTYRVLQGFVSPGVKFTSLHGL